jgi:parvulin-like peptidyl-prolyl isomerase
MPWESDEEAIKPGRNWMRIAWVGIVLLVVAGTIAMFIPRGRNSNVTEARVRHILIKPASGSAEDARAAAEEIVALRERIAKGENFSKLASEYSDDPISAARGGDLGWVRREDLTDAVDQYIWTAPIGEVSQVLFSNNGLHLVEVVERHFSKAEQYDRDLKERVLEGGPAPQPDSQ